MLFIPLSQGPERARWAACSGGGSWWWLQEGQEGRGVVLASRLASMTKRKEAQKLDRM